MPLDRQELRLRLAAVAGRQSGYFTAAQARSVGYSYQAQKFHTDRGNWLRIDRGIFRLPEWPTAAHDNLVRWSLWARDLAIVSHDTALSVHDLGDPNLAVVHLIVPPNFRSRDAGVQLHKGIVENADIEERSGFRVTRPVRTLVDVAASHLDVEQLARAARRALHRDPTIEAELRGRAEELPSRAAVRLERALTMASAG